MNGGNFDGPIDGRISGATTQEAFREAFGQDLNELFSRENNQITSYIIDGAQFPVMTDTYQTTLSAEDFLKRIENKHAELSETNIEVTRNISGIEQLEVKHEQKLESYIESIKSEQFELETKIETNKQQLLETTDPEQRAVIETQQSELTTKYEGNTQLLSQLEAKISPELTKEPESIEIQNAPQISKNPLINNLFASMHDPEALMKAVMDVTNSPAGQALIQRGIDQAVREREQAQELEQQQELENQSRTRDAGIGR